MTSFVPGKWLERGSGGKKNGTMWEASTNLHWKSGMFVWAGQDTGEVKGLNCEYFDTVCYVSPNKADSYTGNIKVYTSLAKMCTKLLPLLL